MKRLLIAIVLFVSGLVLFGCGFEYHHYGRRAHGIVITRPVHPPVIIHHRHHCPPPPPRVRHHPGWRH